MAVTRAMIDEFVSQKSLALVGVSRDGKRGFGNTIRKELAAKGVTLHLVHAEAEAIGGQPCARTLAEVADKVRGVVLVTPPAATEQLVAQAAEAGIRRVWIQQGAESAAAISLAEEKGLAVVHHQCLLMFVAPEKFPHGFHRWLRKIFHRLPQ
jgi:uncharacterized protein